MNQGSLKNVFRRSAPAVLLLVLALRLAAVAESAPVFTARTTNGDTFDNDSLRGKVVLVQFWTTWCPYCRREQPIVDMLVQQYANQGLVVLAVDVRESKETVLQYLEEKPRLCPIVLTPDTNLVSKFKPTGFPRYIVIKRDGYIATDIEGASGEKMLRAALLRAGIESNPIAAQARGPQASKSSAGLQMQVIELAPVKRIIASNSSKPALFVFKNGDRVEAAHYLLSWDSVQMTPINAEPRTVELKLLDLKATTAANHERGLELQIPSSRGEITLGP